MGNIQRPPEKSWRLTDDFTHDGYRAVKRISTNKIRPLTFNRSEPNRVCDSVWLQGALCSVTVTVLL